jgi:DNA-binding protein YbaB
MFSKLKHLKDLRNQAKTMQNALAEEKVTVENKGVTITINGNMEVLSFTINEELGKEKLESAAKDAVNESIKKVQKVMATKMREMGGLPGLE